MLLLSVIAILAIGRSILPPDTIGDVLASFGIRLENHYVTTEDGYILNMHRLAGNAGKPVMFFQHGLLGSSATWLANDQASPAVYFWNRGYDVWLGNNRGNIYSRNHTSLHPEKNTTFWDFSYSTLGDCDVPAQVNYVIARTAKANLTYVGWSQGTTQMFVNQAGNPQATGKKCHIGKVSGINLFIALAPVVYLRHSHHWIIRILSWLGIMKHEEKRFPLGFLKSPVALNETVEWVCTHHIIRYYCKDARKYAQHGFEGPMNEKTAAANLRVLTPAGTSWKSIRHYAQALGNRYFRDFSYGFFGNTHIYGYHHSPIYNMGLKSSITAPTALFFAENDAHVDKWDQDNLLYAVRNNPNVVFHKVYKDFDHDTWAIANKKAQLYLKDMEHLVKKYNPESRNDNVDKSFKNVENHDDNVESLSKNVKGLCENSESLHENSENLCENCESLHENAESFSKNANVLHEHVENLNENTESTDENAKTPRSIIKRPFENAERSYKSIENLYKSVECLYKNVESLSASIEGLYENI